MSSFICGMVCTAQGKTDDQFKPLQDYLTQTYPAFFYRNWGFRHLGNKYYGILADQEVLLKNIPAAEQWFYKSFLNKFKREITDNSATANKAALLEEIETIPLPHRLEVVRGPGDAGGCRDAF